MFKTRIRLISLLLVVVLLLNGCVMDFLTSWDKAYGYYEPTAFSEMEYTRPDLLELQNILDTAHSTLQTAKSLQEVLNVIYSFNAFYDRFFTNFSLANIYYCTDLTNSYWQEEYNFCAESEAAVYAALDELYTALAKSSFRTELEQEEYFGVDYFDAYESDSFWDNVFQDLWEEEATLVNRYYDLSDEALEYTMYSEEYYDQFAVPMVELLAELVTVRQKIAQYAGYPSYTQYAYINSFSRNYTPEQVDQYTQKISQVLSELYTQVMPNYNWQEALSYSSPDDTFRYVAQAAKLMGGTLQEAFLVLSEKGLYDISFDENKYPSSFELYLWDYTSPFVFVYPYCDASDKLTFAHEFGHFAADYVCYGSYAGTDISEIHSQAFEYLSLCYTKNTEELTQLKMLDSLRVYVECAAYTQFEHQLYQMTAEELTVDNILALYDQIGQQFGFGSGCDPRELVTISHFYTDPLYNISYVLSNDLALQFYQKEQLYEGSGLKLYEQCLTDQGSDILVFVETYHLDSPFTEGRLEAIAETFRDILIP